MSVELWDVLDSRGRQTGKRVARGIDVLRQGEYHLVVHIWVLSSDGRVLIQRRSSERELMPGEWAATGGSAISGETSFDAAKRELKEELGISRDKNTLLKLLRLKRHNSFLDVWVTTSDTPSQSFVLQKSEVAEVKWIKMSELVSMIETGGFHDYGDRYFDSVFEKIEDYRGTFV